MAPPYSSSFSVSVVLPASGWLMMAKVRRVRTASPCILASSSIEATTEPSRFMESDRTERSEGQTPQDLALGHIS